MARPRILVTNDDGIDSLGLHALARAVSEHGDVTVVAPDREFSGSGASIGSIFLNKPTAHRREIDDLPGEGNVWALEASPALCIMLVRMGAFDVKPDIIVSGINPGANVGRSVYHSGTIGACLTGRNAGVPGVAISQALQMWSANGQVWDEAVAGINWDTSATIAADAVRAMLQSPATEPGVLNINVPDKPLTAITDWAWTSVAEQEPKDRAKASLEPVPGHTNSFEIAVEWGKKWDAEDGSDVHAIAEGKLSLTWLSKIDATPDPNSHVGPAVTNLLANHQ